MFIVSLAIADLIVGLVVMPMSTVYIFTVDWWFGVGLCQLWIAVDYTASTASILNLFILSLDRYWSVTMPLKYLSKRTTKRDFEPGPNQSSVRRAKTYQQEDHQESNHYDIAGIELFNIYISPLSTNTGGLA